MLYCFVELLRIFLNLSLSDPNLMNLDETPFSTHTLDLAYHDFIFLKLLVANVRMMDPPYLFLG